MPDVVHGAARVGLAAKGVMYALLSVLALRVAAGGEAAADTQGALHTVAAQPSGTLLLAALALGFLAYALWQAFAFRRADNALSRAAAVGRGIAWAALAFSAGRLVLGARVDRNPEQTLTARLLDWPLGPWLVAVAGVAVAVVGLTRLRDLRGHGYLDNLRPVGRQARRVIKGITVTGISARAGVFALVGAFLIRAGVQHRSRSGVGLDGTLAQLAAQPYGTWLLAVLALGLAAYALWCGVRARYEEVRRAEG